MYLISPLWHHQTPLVSLSTHLIQSWSRHGHGITHTIVSLLSVDIHSSSVTVTLNVTLFPSWTPVHAFPFTILQKCYQKDYIQYPTYRVHLQQGKT